jgi:CrcB protein
MKVLVQTLAVAGGGAVGAVLRWVVGTVCGRVFRTDFPVGTLVINLTGSFFLGWFMTLIGGRLIVSETVRLAVSVGFVGAYTTFSTYMYESNALMGSGEEIKASVNLIGSVVLGLIAVRLGVWAAGR